MPKGDRLKLKADPEDGTTPIANLLLEAVAMAKISGLQKGAILYLWRRTYGWVEDGKRLKERKITLLEWKNALDSTKPRVSTTLAELEAKGIMKRRMADAWGGYYYSINTNIASWNSNCLNIAKLAELVTVPNFGTVTENRTIPQTNNSSDIGNSNEKGNSSPKEAVTVTENGTEQLPKTEHASLLYKEILNKDRNKTVDEKPSTSFVKEIGDVILRLEKLRGYKTTKREAEAGAIKRMLKNGKYTTDQIISTWEKLKTQPFWQPQELFMMTIESQIGAVLSGTHSRDNQKIGNANTDNPKDTKSKDYTGGKYGHMVKS